MSVSANWFEMPEDDASLLGGTRSFVDIPAVPFRPM